MSQQPKTEHELFEEQPSILEFSFRSSTVSQYQHEGAWIGWQAARSIPSGAEPATWIADWIADCGTETGHFTSIEAATDLAQQVRGKFAEAAERPSGADRDLQFWKDTAAAYGRELQALKARGAAE